MRQIVGCALGTVVGASVGQDSVLWKNIASNNPGKLVNSSLLPERTTSKEITNIDALKSLVQMQNTCNNQIVGFYCEEQSCFENRDCFSNYCNMYARCQNRQKHGYLRDDPEKNKATEIFESDGVVSPKKKDSKEHQKVHEQASQLIDDLNMKRQKDENSLMKDNKGVFEN